MLRKTLLALGFAAAALVTTPASAVTLGLSGFDWSMTGAATITLSPVVPGGNQPRNLPCIICGANQPQQPTGFGYNRFGNDGNDGTISYFSTAVVPSGNNGGPGLDLLGTGYGSGDGSLLRQFIGTDLTFSVGLDVNDTGVAQTLESFWLLNLTDRRVIAVFSPEPGGVPVLAPNNGTGFPDYTLDGLRLTAADLGDQIIFFARITGANDGPDSFFLIPDQQATVPEPATWAMMLLGFLGIGTVAMRKRRKAQLRLV